VTWIIKRSKPWGWLRMLLARNVIIQFYWLPRHTLFQDGIHAHPPSLGNLVMVRRSVGTGVMW
jgi:hypothetical protein